MRTRVYLHSNEHTHTLAIVFHRERRVNTHYKRFQWEYIVTYPLLCNSAYKLSQQKFLIDRRHIIIIIIYYILCVGIRTRENSIIFFFFFCYKHWTVSKRFLFIFFFLVVFIRRKERERERNIYTYSRMRTMCHRTRFSSALAMNVAKSLRI